MNTSISRLTFILIASILSSCELHDSVDTTIKRKAVVYLRYNYNDGQQNTMDEVQSMRLFLFDLATDRLYRDTTLTREAFLTDTGAMQTYISTGRYSIVCMANVGTGSTASTPSLSDARIEFSERGADPLYYGRVETPIAKGDSLRFDIDLFKSVYKVNIKIDGMQNLDHPEDFYFGLTNYSSLTFENKPGGMLKIYKPDLIRDITNGTMSGSFYTPYFPTDTPITVGIYCDNPASIYGHELFKTSIGRYMEIAPSPGKDVEIGIHIILNGAEITLIISDWDGTVIQEEHLGM